MALVDVIVGRGKGRIQSIVAGAAKDDDDDDDDGVFFFWTINDDKKEKQWGLGLMWPICFWIVQKTEALYVYTYPQHSWLRMIRRRVKALIYW